MNGHGHETQLDAVHLVTVWERDDMSEGRRSVWRGVEKECDAYSADTMTVAVSSVYRLLLALSETTTNRRNRLIANLGALFAVVATVAAVAGDAALGFVDDGG